jgi:hypothetical protein
MRTPGSVRGAAGNGGPYRHLGPRQQGDLGEFSAMEWLASRGAVVCVPVGHSPNFDLIAQLDGEIMRIQVKTTRRTTPKGHFQVMLCTRGGNQSWNGVTKHFEQGRYDWLFVLVGDGRRWFIPSVAIEARSAICVGGTKYGEFEIERGRPFAGAAAGAR